MNHTSTEGFSKREVNPYVLYRDYPGDCWKHKQKEGYTPDQKRFARLQVRFSRDKDFLYHTRFLYKGMLPQIEVVFLSFNE